MKFQLLIPILIVSSYCSYLGIDVSYHQGKINWPQVASSKHFVIIRAGYTNNVDSKWETNYMEAKKAGLKVGAYWYTKAKSEADAESDANQILKLLKGKKLEWPIYYDIEEQSIFQDGIEDIITHKFCSILENNNYYCGIFSFYDALTNNFKGNTKNVYDVWLSHYTTNTTYKGKYQVWQHSKKGACPGIVGDVDLDIGYIDYEVIMKKNGKNGFNFDNSGFIWNYLISSNSNCSQYGTAALMGYFNEISGLQSDLYEEKYHSSIGLNNQEYTDRVNKGTYNNFINDNIGYGLAQWNSYESKNQLLKSCQGKINDIECQLRFVIYELENKYKDLWEILRTCNHLSFCSNKIVEFSKNQNIIKKNSIYNYAVEYYKSFSKKCNSTQFFSFIVKDCYDFPKIPTNCDFIGMLNLINDGHFNNPYNISCWKDQYRCLDNYYYNYSSGGCELLRNEYIIPGCLYYDSGEEIRCKQCNKNYNLKHLGDYNYICSKSTKQIEHCANNFEDMYGNVSCWSCEMPYYVAPNSKCIKVPAHIDNCEVHEEFYNGELSCLKIEEIEENEEEEENSYLNSNEISFKLLILIVHCFLFF